MSDGSQMRITPTEIQVLKNTFKGNEELLRLMRKVFLPELDPFAPLGQNFDLWMTVKLEDKTPEQAMIELKARNALIAHVDQCLLQIKLLVENSEPVDSKKNSTK